MGFLSSLFGFSKGKTGHADQKESVERLVNHKTPFELSGVHYSNPDGKKRAEIISKNCKVGECLRVMHDRGDKDPTALKVLTESGEVVGTVPKELAKHYSAMLEDDKLELELRIVAIKRSGPGNWKPGDQVAGVTLELIEYAR